MINIQIGKIDKTDTQRGWHERYVTIIDDKGELEHKSKEEMEKILEPYLREKDNDFCCMWFWVYKIDNLKYHINYGFDSSD